MKKHEEDQILSVFVRNVWSSVARLESLVSPQAARTSVAWKKNPRSVEALNGLGISGALHLGQRTSTDGAALGITLQP